MKQFKINLKSFWDFCKRFDLAKGLAQLTEPERCYKSTRMIYQFMFMMSAIGKDGFLKMDQAGRFGKLKKLFRLDRFRDKRLQHCVVSDTTMIDRLGKLDIRSSRRISYAVLSRGLQSGYIQPIAFVDGTGLCGRLYSCLCFMTRFGDVLMVDCEEIEKRGKELLASQRLIRRCCDYLGKGSIKLLLADMLYFNEGFYHLRKDGYIGELLIKYTPDPGKGFLKPYRKILQYFEGLRSLYLKAEQCKNDRQKLYRMNFRFSSGYDESRRVHYNIWHAGNNELDNRYAVARVVEADGNGTSLHDFYVITTDKQLTAQRMRELGHKRWYVENDGFKRLNAHLASKRIWSKHPTVASNLIQIWMTAMSLLVLFYREIAHHIKRQYCQVKLTHNFLSCILSEEPYGRVRLDGI